MVLMLVSHFKQETQRVKALIYESYYDVYCGVMLPLVTVQCDYNTLLDVKTSTFQQTLEYRS